MNKSKVFIEGGTIFVYLKSRGITYLCGSLCQGYEYLKKERLAML